jgi:hypothetical protein
MERVTKIGLLSVKSITPISIAHCGSTLCSEIDGQQIEKWSENSPKKLRFCKWPLTMLKMLSLGISKFPLRNDLQKIKSEIVPIFAPFLLTPRPRSANFRSLQLPNGRTSYELTKLRVVCAPFSQVSLNESRTTNEIRNRTIVAPYLPTRFHSPRETRRAVSPGSEKSVVNYLRVLRTPNSTFDTGIVPFLHHSCSLCVRGARTSGRFNFRIVEQVAKLRSCESCVHHFCQVRLDWLPIAEGKQGSSGPSKELPNLAMRLECRCPVWEDLATAFLRWLCCLLFNLPCHTLFVPFLHKSARQGGRSAGRRLAPNSGVGF